jgi:translation initiation factor eIF-2B subunit delta
MIDETIEEIREMQTHSSSVVALKATRALGDLATREFETVDEFDRAVQQNAGALRRANPSHASLHNAMREVLEEVSGTASTVASAKARLQATVERVVTEIETGKAVAARAAAESFVDGETFMTHDYSSTVLEAVNRALDERDLSLTAYVTEARPRYLGRKTARELAARDRVEPHLLVDGAASCFLEECDRVVVGMDCIVDGTLYNRVGTYPLAVVANRMDVPVVVVGSATKLIEDGFRFENEHRPTYEVMLEPVEGVYLENPAYDATPVDLVDAVITGDDRADR